LQETYLATGHNLLAALPLAVYTTDTEGRITFYNDPAAEFWGHRPEIGTSKWCGSWRLYWPDGRPMPHEDCPMAMTLREGHPVRGAEAIAERPDGTRIPFRPYPALLKDGSGRVTGAINVLVDISEHHNAEIDLERLAAIVSSSDDAIISKTLEGRVTSWNAGAARIFGYPPEEMLGQPIIRIIPPELRHEEEDILARLRRGERLEHFDTVRIAKDGRRLNISLTVSPLRDKAGNIVGASKVARDVTERKRNEELQHLLFDELNHRVKNTLAIIQAIADQSLRSAASPENFVASFSGRVQALARAHDILVLGGMKGADVVELVREQVMLGAPDNMRVFSMGPHVILEPRAAVQLALVLHELATNARKYGALSTASGRLDINWNLQAGAKRQLLFNWKESGVPNTSAPNTRGFGTTLIERSLEGNGGEAMVRYVSDGLICEIRLPLSELETSGVLQPAAYKVDEAQSLLDGGWADLRGKRILLVEDEPLIGLEVEAVLVSAGCEIIGPAATIERAKHLIKEASFDAALVDANLGGHQVDEVAAALTQKGIPFAFATGYGRNALPLPFRDADVLAKPFNPDQVGATVRRLLARARNDTRVVPLHPKTPLSRSQSWDKVGRPTSS
jgi:PAS domain S-box-containing protein